MTMTTTASKARFGLEDVLTAMRKIVEARGHGYTYEPVSRSTSDGCQDAACSYSDAAGQPSCLIGHVINALDPDAFLGLAEQEEDAESEQACALMDVGWLPKGFWSEEALTAAWAAQRVQDKYLTWGEALHAAENLGADAD